MRKSPQLLLLLFLFPFMACAQDVYRITYISNEGFLVECRGKKVLIDGLFDQIDANWCDSPTKQTVDLMESAAPPFDQVDLIAITHKHIDHFSEGVVIKHLIKNPAGKVLCPNQVREVLKQNPEYGRIKDRIVSLTPAELHDSSLIVSGIPVRVLRLEHSHYMEKDLATGEMKNRHQDIENLGFLLTIEGLTFFHCGDTNPLNKEEYSTYALQNDSIDVAFLERMFVARGKEGMAIIDEYIQADHTVFMHINPANVEAFAAHFRGVDNVSIFEQKMDSIQIELLP